ncbi:zinc finger-like domain-containing protein [Marinobacter adhaerens]|uniref:Zinc finger-like domain-containing protein n=2 Tax=Marinobacter adhaerens TaxID=1033846 RepID=A0ABX8IPF8_9GAMM|nr:zinc finger-like domain-containing protein [Marinobacter adhaerens]QWV14434.1 zinc finger-like domain-containing protein [Marinobacter adhaerens]
MRKASGPTLTKQKRPLKRCPTCHGRGVVKPMFYELPCDHCESSGVVCKETGEGLPASELILQLRLRLNEKEQEIKGLHRQLADERAKDDSRGYGAGGSRYHGD